ncbi:MAG: dihydroneopterin aldolase [Bacillota bacterium]
MADYIRLKGLKFYGYHGVLAEEKELGQRFIVDLALQTDLKPAGVSDDLTESINYAEVYEVTKQVVEGESYDLIEAVAESIAAKLLSEFTRIKQVQVQVKKPAAPVAGILDWAEVEIERERVE